MQELDIYGRQIQSLGNSNFIPHRFAGQIYDPEIDLCYNRLRYYDCNTGAYISQDPLRINSRNYNFYKFVKDVNTVVDLFGIDWNYILVDKAGNPYYHGRVSDNTSMEDVARRHATTEGVDGNRFGEGDKIRKVTEVGTPKTTVRGIEQRGIAENDLLGKGSENVRGNKINGISEANQNTAIGKTKLDEADKLLNGKKVSQLPAIGDELEFDPKYKPHH